jgi:hypothetical protein
MNGRRLRNRRHVHHYNPEQLVNNYIDNNNLIDPLQIPMHNVDDPREFLTWLINRSVAYQDITGDSLLVSVNENTYISLNGNIRDDFLQNLDNFFTNVETYGSDGEFIENFMTGNFFTIEIQSRFLQQDVFADIPDNNPDRIRDGGAFFNKLNKTNLDLSRYGIYKTINLENYTENCLVKAFSNHKNINDTQINQLKSLICYDTISKDKLKLIAENLDVKLILYHPRSHNSRRKIHYNKTATNIVEIGLLNNHYFIFEKTNYCKNDININLNSNVKMNSYNIINFLLTDLSVSHCLENIKYNSEILKTQYYEKINDDNINNLDYTEQNYKLCSKNNYVKEEKEDDIKYNNIIFFDFETYVDKKTNMHIPYLVCYIDNKNRRRCWEGPNCGEKFINSIKEPSILIAHNISYDANFIIKYIVIHSIIKKSNRLYQLKGATMKKVKIILKDSYLMISKPLRDFGKMFNLNQEKEVMNYDIYNDYFNKRKYNKIKINKYKISDAIKIFNEEDKKQFLNNIKKWKCSDGKYMGTKFFNLIKYSREYCFIDCDVLKAGYNIFRKWILESCQLDINEILTSASLADKYFKNNNCFEGIYELSGVPRKFIQNCLVGGRCMSNQNKKYNLTEKILDYDAVSLYPSAIDRLGGYLKGLPKKIDENQLNYEFLKKQDGYFVNIIVNSVGIKRDFPLLSIVKDSGVRNFTNNVVGKSFFVDKIALEDLIKFQKITFTIIKGYYFNEGRNKLSKDITNFLFNERIKKKKEKNSIQEVYKLIMNSAYGKTIMKPIIEEDKVFNKAKDFRNFYRNNSNYIKEFTQIDGFNKVIVKKVKPIVEHYSRPHIGIEILSMSKRIMNEVMCLAEDNNIKIYYQDTDSMHIKQNGLDDLKKLFFEKYNKILDGNLMGQFNSDFSMKEDISNKVHARRTIILAKKCYIDEIIGYDKKDKELIEYHCRMKGIPNASLKYHCKINNINLVELYEKLYNGEEIEFDLLCGGEKVKFKQNKNFTICSLQKFTRKIKFN